MARIDEDPDQRDKTPLQLEAILTCPNCLTDFDYVFQAPEGIYYKEDLVEAPTSVVRCPNPECGHEWTAEYEGWIAHEDAG